MAVTIEKTVTIDDAIQSALQNHEELTVPKFAFLSQMKTLRERKRAINPEASLDANERELSSIRSAYNCLYALGLIDSDDYVSYVEELQEINVRCQDSYFR